MMHSDGYQSTHKTFDSWACIQAILKNNSGKSSQDLQENMIMLQATHKGQTDYAIVSSWELCALSGKMPKYNFTEANQFHATLMLNFLAKLEEK